MIVTSGKQRRPIRWIFWKRWLFMAFPYGLPRMNAELAWMVAIFWIDRKPVRGAEARRTELISRMDLKVVGDGGPRTERGGINRVGTRTRRRDYLWHGQHGQQKIGLILFAGMKRVRAGKRFGWTIGRVVAEGAKRRPEAGPPPPVARSPCPEL